MREKRETRDSLDRAAQLGRDAENLMASDVYKRIMARIREELANDLRVASNADAVMMAGHAMRSFLELENIVASIALNGKLAGSKLEKMSND
jgi:hypothetical protein